MKRINSAVSLLSFIGGTAAGMAEAAQEGLVKHRKQTPANNPAGSKLARQIERGTKGFTCRVGFPINVKV